MASALREAQGRPSSATEGQRLRWVFHGGSGRPLSEVVPHLPDQLIDGVALHRETKIARPRVG